MVHLNFRSTLSKKVASHFGHFCIRKKHPKFPNCSKKILNSFLNNQAQCFFCSNDLDFHVVNFVSFYLKRILKKLYAVRFSRKSLCIVIACGYCLCEFGARDNFSRSKVLNLLHTLISIFMFCFFVLS